MSADGVFPVSYSPTGAIDKYSSAEFMHWGLAYALGDVSGGGTIIPIDPGVTLELPYFTVVEQVPEGGSMALDTAYIGCAVEDFRYEFSYGAGRATGKCNVGWNGSGILAQPSGVTVPDVTVEHNMLSAGMQLTVSGTDYVALKTILRGHFEWKNNLLMNAGLFPGSGLQDGAGIRGRLEIGTRAVMFQYTARLLSGSGEYAKLRAITKGALSLAVSYDSTHSILISMPQVSFETINVVDVDGLVAITVDCAVQKVAGSPVVSVTALSGLSGVAA